MDRNQKKITNANPKIDKPRLDLEKTDPAFDEQDPLIIEERLDLEDRKKEPQEKKDDLPKTAEPEKKIVVWRGPVELHECPNCGARILQDRLTRACRVTGTKQPYRSEDGKFCQDRYMRCMRCGKDFIAREKIS